MTPIQQNINQLKTDLLRTAEVLRSKLSRIQKQLLIAYGIKDDVTYRKLCTRESQLIDALLLKDVFSASDYSVIDF